MSVYNAACLAGCLPHSVVVVVEQRARVCRPRARGVRRAPAREDPSVLRLEATNLVRLGTTRGNFR